MRVEVSPQRAPAPPGVAVAFAVAVTNTSDVISGHVIRVLGADPSWVRIDRERLSLFPGATETVTVTVTTPPGLPAGDRRVAIQVRELTPPHGTQVHEVDLAVPPARAMDIRVDPRTVTGGRRGAAGVVIENTGNTTIAGPLVGSDDQEKIQYRFAPAALELGPGEQAAVELKIKARRPLMGNPIVRVFTVKVDEPVDPEKEPVFVGHGSFMQRAFFSRGAISLGGLLLAVTVFAIVITLALSNVVGRSAADRDLALQVAQARNASSTTGTGSLTGTVRLLTSGSPVPGVTVEVFATSDVANAVTTAATDDRGVYTLSGLTQGSYKLRFRGAGFAELWYPGALTDADAQTITLDSGQTRAGLDVRLGGLPATLSGTVQGADVAGATVTLALPGTWTTQPGSSGQTVASAPTTAPTSATAAQGAIIRTVTVAADGVFKLDQVPSPSVYDLVVSKTGYATETQRIDVGGGENRSGIDIRLRQGDGLIAGHVTSASGPLGGVTVTATYNGTTVRTVSLTQDDVGAFTLRGLPTPGTFTVVVSKDGFASQTLNLSLASGQQLSGVGVTLGGAAGSLFGTVTTLADGQPAGGVTVTVTNGAMTVQTVTQSTGGVGGWTVTGLTVPSTYTVTFSRADLASQTLSVSLNAFGGATSGSGGATSSDHVDAALSSSTAVLKGTATEAGSAKTLGEVTITLTSAGGTYQVTTASVPSDLAGQYEIDRLPPGTYTVSVSRSGTRPTSTIVTLTAGDVQEYDPVLAAPASITGTVKDASGKALPNATVRLYLASQYPTTVLRTTTTDGNGTYAFAAVEAPDNYVVELVPAGSTAPADSKTVTVSASQHVVVDLSTAPVASPSPSGP